MSKLPPLELLKSTHAFPGPYIFKVIGSNEETFVARVVAAIREELAYTSDPPYEARESSGGRHVALTIELMMDSPERVHAVYERLMKLPGLLVML